VVAGDFIGHQSVLLISGDSEKRQLFHVVRGGKERKRREEREEKKREREERREEREEKEREEGKREYEDSVGGCVGRFCFQSPEV
jgi:hypothetical protein